MLRRRLNSGVRIWDQAELAWTILVAVAMMERFSGKRTITYGDLAEMMGYDRKAGITLSRCLDLVGQMCLKNRLPPLNVLVVGAHGQPGPEVILRPGSSVEADQAAVLQEDWFSWRAPVAGSFRSLLEELKGRKSPPSDT
jgi:hypothetical protein